MGNGGEPVGKPEKCGYLGGRRDLKAWNIREEWATDRGRRKGLCKTRFVAQREGGKRRKNIVFLPAPAATVVDTCGTCPRQSWGLGASRRHSYDESRGM